MKLHVVDIGDWVKFPETIHEFYAHLADLIGNSFKFYALGNRRLILQSRMMEEASRSCLRRTWR